MYTDGDTTDSISYRVGTMYELADNSEKVVLDTFLIKLVGYSLKTLIRSIKDDQPENQEIPL
jgi:hypothetical protein